MTSEELQRKQISTILSALERLAEHLDPTYDALVDYARTRKTALDRAREEIERLRELVVKGESNE